MAAAVGLRNDFGSSDLRVLAKTSRDASQARRLLALAEIYDGGSRTDAARIGGVGLQTVRDKLAFQGGRGNRLQPLIPVAGKVIQPKGGYRLVTKPLPVPQEGVEDDPLSITPFVAWTDFVSVAGYEVAQRDALKGLPRIGQIGCVCLNLDSPRPSLRVV